MASGAGEQYNSAIETPSSGSRLSNMSLRTADPEQPADATTPTPSDHSAFPPHGSASLTAAQQPLLSTPVVMTDQQLLFLLQSLRSLPPIQCTPPPILVASPNFANCTARFNGTSDIKAFTDAVNVYKECVGVDDDIALRDLPMVLTDFAATWWQDVKYSVSSWSQALHLLRETFGTRLPPHKIYREVFSREQAEERTDIFIWRIRALIAQLPPNTLPENPVQLDMVYGLLHKRIQEKIARFAFSSFDELLRRAREVEDILEEVHITSSPETDSSSPTSTSSADSRLYIEPQISKVSPQSGSINMLGHLINDCLKDSRTPPCSCERHHEECKYTHCPSPSIPSVLQSVYVVDPVRDQRVRPIFNTEVFGVAGTALLDTDIKQSIASVSFTKLLRTHGQVFERVHTELHFTDGTIRMQTVETALVSVKVQGVITVPTLFVVVPDAIKTVLGKNFIRASNMILNLEKNVYSIGSTGFQSLRFEHNHRRVIPFNKCGAGRICVRAD